MAPRYVFDPPGLAAVVAICLEQGWNLCDAHHRRWAKEHDTRCPSIEMKEEMLAEKIQTTMAYCLAEIRADMRRSPTRLVLPPSVLTGQ
jgi:hypothetical protein